MADIKNGRVIIVKFGGYTLEGVTSNVLALETNMIDSTTKDSGAFNEFIPGNTQGTISVEVNYDKNATYNINYLIGLQIAGTSGTAYFGETASGGTYYSASAYIASTNISAPNDDKASGTVEIQLTGAITQTVIS